MRAEAPRVVDRRFTNMDSNLVGLAGLAVGYLAAYHFGAGDFYAGSRKGDLERFLSSDAVGLIQPVMEFSINSVLATVSSVASERIYYRIATSLSDTRKLSLMGFASQLQRINF